MMYMVVIDHRDFKATLQPPRPLQTRVNFSVLDCFGGLVHLLHQGIDSGFGQEGEIWLFGEDGLDLAGSTGKERGKAYHGSGSRDSIPANSCISRTVMYDVSVSANCSRIGQLCNCDSESHGIEEIVSGKRCTYDQDISSALHGRADTPIQLSTLSLAHYQSTSPA